MTPWPRQEVRKTLRFLGYHVARDEAEVIQIIVLLYYGPGGKPALEAYGARVQPILHEHGGRMVSASRPSEPRDGDPDAIDIIHFDDQARYEAFRADPRHAGLIEMRQDAIRDVRLYITDQFVTYID